MTDLPFGEVFFGLSWLDAIIRIVIVVLVMTLVVVYLTYGERKVVARFQMRLGPTRTGPIGLLQGFADAIKLLIKEDVRPRNADRWVFEFAPYLTFIPVFLVLVALPFAQDWGVRNLALGMFFVFAVLGLNIVGVLMAGLGSGNKYALLGGVRAAAQMISYEIPLVVALLAVAMVAGTLDLNAIVGMQDSRPFILIQPLAFVIFFTAMLSELHRAPFDIPVAESEIVGGYFVEYSGIRWSMFQLAEYASLWAFSIFGSAIFLGGWAFPFGEDWGWGWQLVLTLIKSLIMIMLIFWVRATLPRLRMDQLMSFCWKALIEVSFALLLVNGLFLYYDWPEPILAAVNWVGAILFLGGIYLRAARKPSTKNLVGSYKHAEVPNP
ncbi:MAG: NADH-quinone oxidoreductase subunit NuoH [Dehalococcoidia bacterium]|nr:NADH-quinone oxidoreductase subunit NuoH [Dehalococcoidia bacterium]